LILGGLFDLLLFPASSLLDWGLPLASKAIVKALPVTSLLGECDIAVPIGLRKNKTIATARYDQRFSAHIYVTPPHQTWFACATEILVLDGYRSPHVLVLLFISMLRQLATH
jgi:hypothetical protein